MLGERELALAATEGHGIMDMLKSGRCIKIAAPMVRFSKLPWRHVVRSYGLRIPAPSSSSSSSSSSSFPSSSLFQIHARCPVFP
jgi:hypothetical protein